MSYTAPYQDPSDGPAGLSRRSRLALWGSATALLLIPLVAMQLSSAWEWSLFDFAVFGGMLALSALALELFARQSADFRYRAAAGFALLVGFFLLWLTLAVGLIGHERNAANLMFAGVLCVAVLGAVRARLKPRAMAGAMAATAVAQMLTGFVAAYLGHPIWPLTTGFTGLWLGSAWLFQRAARGGETVRAQDGKSPPLC